MYRKLVLSIVGLLVFLSRVSTTQAANFTIPDGDVAAFIAAINTANTLGYGPSTIDLAPGGTYILTSGYSDGNRNVGNDGLPLITSYITINGNGATITRAAGSPEFRFFEISQVCNIENENPCNLALTAGLNINNITLNGGMLTGRNGGAIYNSYQLDVSSTIFSNNSASSGSAIYSAGIVYVDGSTFINNGGGSTFTAGLSELNFSSNMTLSDLTNNTFSGNSGAAVENTSGFAVNIENSTFWNNGSALWNRQGSPYLKWVIMANDKGTPNCRMDNGFIRTFPESPNLDSGDSCGFSLKGGLVNSDPLLAPLANNGGATPTHALQIGSPAIDSAGICSGTDQRGQVRFTDGNGDGVYGCDIGAFEVAGPVLTPPTFSMAFVPYWGIAAGETTQLTFTIANADPVVNLTGLTFSTTFEPFIAIASNPNVADTCGGTIVAPAGGNQIDYSGGTVGAGQTCTVTVKIATFIPIYYSITAQLITDQTGSLPVANASAEIYIGEGTRENPEPPPEEEIPAPSVPLCSDVDGSTDDVVHADVPPGTWGLFCRVITDDSAEIGNEEVLAQGVIQAVDVFSPNGAIGAGTTICLLGEGGIMFLNASQAPRVPQWLPTTYDGIFTCAVIPGTGIVVLVNGTPPDDSGTDAAPPDAESTALSNCQITTTHMVRLRSDPNTNSEVIATLAYQLTLDATERSGNWYRVIYLDGQGWVSGDYLTAEGDCGG